MVVSFILHSVCDVDPNSPIMVFEMSQWALSVSLR